MKRAIAIVLCVAAPLSAQVGHVPERSPYRDLEFRHEIFGYAGYFNAAKEPAGVGPKPAPMVGARYEYRLGGPAYFSAGLGGIFSDRTIIDPAKKIADRVVGTQSLVLVSTDVGLTFQLTGQKSYRLLVPYLNAGLGVTASTRQGLDVGSYTFGTPFTLRWGGGFKIAPSTHPRFRIDFSDHLFKHGYPETYYLKTTEDPAFLPINQKRSFWKHNWAITVGTTWTKGR